MFPRPLKLALSAIAAFFLILSGFALFSARMAIYPWWYQKKLVGERLPECSSYQKRVYQYCDDPKRNLGLAFTEFAAQGEEGTADVTGWWIPRESSPIGSVILVHGGGADRRAMLKHAGYLHEAGFHVLLIDCWNHGLTKGDGRGLSFGLKESESVVTAAKWAVRQKLPTPITVMGTSQGAFAALLAAAHTGLIRAIVAENPYISTRRVLLEFPALEWVPGSAKKLSLPLISHWIGASVDELDVTRFVDRVRVPVLLIHGLNDMVVRSTHSEEILNLLPSPDKQLWLVPHGEHEFLWNARKDEYQKRVVEFLTRRAGA